MLSHTGIPGEQTQVMYSRKAGHAFGISKKGHILVNVGKFEDETLNSKQI